MSMEHFSQLFTEEHPALQQLLEQLTHTTTLVALVMVAWQIGRVVAQRVLEDVLHHRGQRPDGGACCPVCGRVLPSHGLRARTILTLVGPVTWQRRIRCCPHRCGIGQVVPSDDDLGIVPYQQVSWEVQRLACLLAVLMPFALAHEVLARLTGVTVSAKAIWGWVQAWGQEAMTRLQHDLERLASGEFPSEDPLEASLRAMPLVMGADGVMVPFRPTPGTPQGKTRWREVKVGILARLTHRVNQLGQTVTQLLHRRVVAVLGSVDDLRPRLWGEAVRQGILTAPCVAWLSDGGRGLWRLFQDQFAAYAVGILDFYHVMEQVWRGAKAWFDGRTLRARVWFTLTRHRLRHGETDAVFTDLERALALPELPEAVRRSLTNLYTYLDTHREHIDYTRWNALGLPLGSGMVESACKWLIQQRFKGVGMRWSEDGFNHLLHLRLLWANGRFDALFP